MTSPTDVRDALMELIPTGPNFILDTKMHDGIVDLTIQCGGQRWCSVIGINDKSAEQVAAAAEELLLNWVNGTITAMVDTEGNIVSHKYRRAARGFAVWLRNDPKARRWLTAHRKDDGVKRLLRDYRPELEAA
jgi:hypothetical protein